MSVISCSRRGRLTFRGGEVRDRLLGIICGTGPWYRRRGLSLPVIGGAATLLSFHIPKETFDLLRRLGLDSEGLCW